MIDDVAVVESVAGQCSRPRRQKRESSQAQKKKTSEASLLLRHHHCCCLLLSHEVVPFSSSLFLRLANDAGVRSNHKKGRMDGEGRRLAPDVGGDGSCSSRVTWSRSDDEARRCCENILVGVMVAAAAVAASQRYRGDGGNRHARHGCCTAHTQQTSSLGLP